MNNKKQVIIGTSLVCVAFLGIAAIFYFLLNAQQKQIEYINSLKEEVSVLNTEADLSKDKAEELQAALGDYVSLDKFVEAANKIYGPEERSRREGSIWVDRSTNTVVATLGAVNGVLPGTKLAVYAGDDLIGYATVETPMDIISYVKPADFLLNQIDRNYFRIVLEQ